MIPDGWQVQNLADVALIILGQSPPSSACNENVKGYPFYQGNADFGYRHPLAQHWIEKPLKVAKKDDILISVRAPVGELNIANTDCCIGRGVGSIRPLSANRNFIYYTLLNERNSLAYVSQGSTFDAINGKELRNLSLLIPSLPEQEKIAAILSSVDDAIQATQAVIDQTRRVKHGLMQQLLTRGIGHTRFKQTEIGEIPEEWLEGTFGDYLKEIKGGGTPSRKKPTYWGGTIPWASVKDLNGVYLRNTEEYITQEGLNNSASNLIPAGAVIIATRMALGKVVRFSCDVAINQDLKALFPKKELSSDYLFYWLLLQASLIETLGAGSTVKGIRLETLRALKLMLPPIDEQKKIVAILTGVDEALNIEQDKMLQLHKIRKGLLQDLLTGRMRVNLNGEATT